MTADEYIKVTTAVLQIIGFLISMAAAYSSSKSSKQAQASLDEIRRLEEKVQSRLNRSRRSKPSTLVDVERMRARRGASCRGMAPMEKKTR